MENLQLLCADCHKDKSRSERMGVSQTEASTQSISSAEASRDPARTYPSRDAERDSPEPGADSSMSSPGSLTLFDPSSYSSRTFRVSSLPTAVGTSESFLERWPTSGTAWPGAFSTAVSSECRSDGDGCSSSEPSLAEILEPDVPARFSLSARAANGILRRAERRGRALPNSLREALETVASPTQAEPPTTSRT